jgi:Fe2+ transport system protein FeoA
MDQPSRDRIAAAPAKPSQEGTTAATLDRLPLGVRGRITGLDGDDPLTQRLLEMGLIEGEEVEVVGIAPLGDPIEVRLRDYRLSLRRREAARVHVALLP